MAVIESLSNFARGIHELLKSDRDVTIVTTGFTGEGKTTFSYQIIKEYCRIAGVPFTFGDNMTYDREELLKFVDGELNSKTGPNGLKKGQLHEYSPILIDELFSIFYKRNWYNDDQKLAVAVFNMCRDRHLFIIGNIPNFLDLDSGFITRARYHIHIYERGKAWVFEQENNPFTTDQWNFRYNCKYFRQSRKQPYKLPNFVCEIRYPDFQPEEKEKYDEIRNIKRVVAANQVKGEKVERYAKIKRQRDKVIRMILDINPQVKGTDIAKLTGLTSSGVSRIKEGLK